MIPQQLLDDDLDRIFADWETVPFLLRPGILKDGSIHEFPRPVPAIRLQDAWDFQALKVPLVAGDTLVGHSQQGVNILVEGQFQPDADTTDSDRFDAVEDLRELLNVGGGNVKYELYLTIDTNTEQYRKFKSCTTVRFECDLTDSRLFTYRIVIHAEDPVLYATGPGS